MLKVRTKKLAENEEHILLLFFPSVDFFMNLHRVFTRVKLKYTVESMHLKVVSVR
jgi:hypothetical protein